MNRKSLRNLKHLLIVFAFLASLSAIPQAGSAQGAVTVTSLDPATHFYVPDENHGAHQQIVHLHASHNDADANLLQSMVDTPQAVWFTSGTPHRVEQAGRQ